MSNVTDPETVSSHIDLKSHQEEIRKQIESNTVVLYNLKDNNAFYAITPEEARFAIDAIKKRREKYHYCQIVPLKEQEHWKKSKDTYTSENGIIIFSQNISNLQIAIKDYYAQASVPRRGSIGDEDSIGEIFDIAVNPRRQGNPLDGLKKGFLAILMEKILNDLEAYRCILKKLLSDNKITQEELEKLKIKDFEVAVKILYRYTGRCYSGNIEENDWDSMSKESKKIHLEKIMIENQKDYKEFEELVKNAIGIKAI